MTAFLDALGGYVGPAFAFFTLVLLVLGIRLSRDYARTRAVEWLGHERHFAEPARLMPAFLEDPEDPQTVRLAAQLVDARRGAHHHLKVAVAAATDHYPMLMFATISAVIAGTLLIPITGAGWSEASSTLRVPFLTFAAIAFGVLALSRVYRQSSNIQGNIDTYTAFVALEDEILSFAARRRAMGVDPASTNAFIDAVDTKLREIRRYAVGPDATPMTSPASVSRLLETRKVHETFVVDTGENGDGPATRAKAATKSTSTRTRKARSTSAGSSS